MTGGIKIMFGKSNSTDGLLPKKEIEKFRAQDRVVRVTDDEIMDTQKRGEKSWMDYQNNSDKYADKLNDLDKISRNICYFLASPSKKAPKFRLVPREQALFSDDVVQNLSLNDVHQKAIGECFFDASILSVLNQNALMFQLCMRDNGSTVFVKVYEYDQDGKQQPMIYEIDKSTIENDGLIPRNFNAHELWVAILEKTYAICQQRRYQLLTQQTGAEITAPLTAFINGGHGNIVINTFTGRSTSQMCFNQNFTYQRLEIITPFDMYTRQILPMNFDQINREIEKLNPHLNNDASNLYKNNMLNQLIDLSNSVSKRKDVQTAVNLYQLQLSKIKQFEQEGKTEQVKGYKEAFAIFETKAPVLKETLDDLAAISAVDLDNTNKKDKKYDDYLEVVVKIMQQALVCGHAVNLSTKHEFGAKNPFHREFINQGFAAGHEYALLNITKSPAGIAIRYLNPWQHYSVTYDQHQKPQGNMFDIFGVNESKKSRQAFEQKHQLMPRELLDDTLHQGVATLSFVRGYANNEHYNGVSEVLLEDFDQYFELIDIAKLPSAVILLNQVLGITAACIVLDLVIKRWLDMQIVLLISHLIMMVI